MIQFNLLPDVKIQYIKAQNARRMVFVVSGAVSVAALVLLVLFVGYNQLQKKHLRDLNHDIASKTQTLKSTPGIDKILTVQNQLNSLTGLHDTKPAATRLFDYLNQLTPTQASITTLAVDFGLHTVTITGTADSLSTVDKYVDTLKFTKYTTGTNSTATPAFSQVVLSTFNYATATSTQNAPPASYTITFGYDQNIFDITQDVKVSTPTTVTTRSEVDKPTDLFTGGSK
jgi:Tfp pilus assembly protein PilN